jgi:hypothetical protein
MRLKIYRWGFYAAILLTVAMWWEGLDNPASYEGLDWNVTTLFFLYPIYLAFSFSVLIVLEKIRLHVSS